MKGALKMYYKVKDDVLKRIRELEFPEPETVGEIIKTMKDYLGSFELGGIKKAEAFLISPQIEGELLFGIYFFKEREFLRKFILFRCDSEGVIFPS